MSDEQTVPPSDERPDTRLCAELETHRECGAPWDEHICPDQFDKLSEQYERLRAVGPMPKPPSCTHPERPEGKPLCAACWAEYKPAFDGYFARRKAAAAERDLQITNEINEGIVEDKNEVLDRPAAAEEENRRLREALINAQAMVCVEWCVGDGHTKQCERVAVLLAEEREP